MGSNSILIATPKIKQFLFIDSKVEDYQALAAESVLGTEIIILDSAQDGIEQITKALQKYSLSSIHIVSHGSPGCLYLGNAQLSLDTLTSYASQLKAWSVESILLYGCNIAQGDAGEEFINRFYQITGTAIAASTGLTGNAALGGKWELNFKTEDFEAALGFSKELQYSYRHVLAASSVPISDASSNWVPTLVGSKFDYLDDQQSNAGLDVVGSNSNALANLYTKYVSNPNNDSIDYLGFRARYGSAPSGSLALGIDLNGDGAIDAFLGVENVSNTPVIKVYAPGAGSNNSPSTTTILNQANGIVPPISIADIRSDKSIVTVSDTTISNSDIDADSKTDVYLSFLVNFNEFASAINSIVTNPQNPRKTSGWSGLTKDTPLRYIIFTAASPTPNAINGDLSGVNGNLSSTQTFTQLGALTDFQSFSNPATTTILPKVAINSITDDVSPATGTIASGGSSNDITPTLAGTISNSLGTGAFVAIYQNGTKVGNATVTDTNWSYSDSNLSNGNSYNYTARVEDGAGNQGPVSAAYSLTIDTAAPTVAINADKTSLKSGETSSITFSFSEVPVGFNSNALSAVGGTIGNLQQSSSDPKVYTATFTPSSNTQTIGSITVGSGYTDGAGNTGIAKSLTNLTIDTAAPTADIVDVSPDPRNSNAGIITINFSENVNGVDVSDFSLTRDGNSVDLSGLSVTPVSGSQYTIDFSSVTRTAGTYTLTLNTGTSSIQDARGNMLATSISDIFVVNGPNVADDFISVTSGTGISINTLGNDSDPNQQPLRIIEVSDPLRGTATLSNNGTPDNPSDDRIFYLEDSPTTSNRFTNLGLFSTGGNVKSFTDTFSYTVADSEGIEATASINITVAARAQLKFTLTGNQSFTNEVGFFKVDDENGTIDGIAPGQEGYVGAALRSGQVIFSSLRETTQLFGTNPTRIIDGFNSDDLVNFFLVSNGTIDGVLSEKSSASVFFATPNANRDSFNPLQTGKVGTNAFSFGWEDAGGSGDRDFNDLTLQVEVTDEPTLIGSNLQGGSQQEMLDLTDFNSNQTLLAEIEIEQNASYNNTVGLYRIEDASGSVRDPVTGTLITPGQEGYEQAALAQSVAQYDRSTTFTEFDLAGGAFYAPYISGVGKQVYFPTITANPDGVDHIRLLGDNTFGFEDTVGGYDSDYDDAIVKVNITGVNA